MTNESILKFIKCEICSNPISGVDYDTPLYCKKCISEMEKRNLSPSQYTQFRELKQTLK